MKGSSSEGFGFAFNNKEFSDRVLRLEIFPDNQLSHSQPPINDSDDSSDGVKTTTLHCSSIILASKSPIFYKLLMKGSQEKDVTIRINSSQEAALMDLVKFMYTDALSSTATSDLLDVLFAANEFEVTSCIEHCVQLLQEKPISLENALLCLKLPSTSSESQPLIDASKRYIVAYFMDFEKCKEEALQLPLYALEIVLGSDGLQVDSEDAVYDFILDWGYANFINLEERREILTSVLARFVCFQYLSTYRFREVLACEEFHHEQVSKLVMEALFLKHQVPYGQHIKGTRRLYNRRLVNMVPLKYPSPRAIVYFNLEKEECEALDSSTKIVSESFLLGGRWFGFEAEKKSSLHFGIYLYIIQGSETCTMDFDFAVMKKRSRKYEIQGDSGSIISTVKRTGWRLFRVSLDDFMGDDSEYFVDGILHLRAEITIITS